MRFAAHSREQQQQQQQQQQQNYYSRSLEAQDLKWERRDPQEINYQK